MRVISQNGNYDLPYEQIVVRSEMEYVMAVHKEKEYVLGKYSSDDKAIKAMEMLREQYGKLEVMKVLASGTAEYMEKEFERLKKCGVIVRAENQPSKVDFINNAIFQFPQDDEIEV